MPSFKSTVLFGGSGVGFGASPSFYKASVFAVSPPRQLLACFTSPLLTLPAPRVLVPGHPHPRESVAPAPGISHPHIWCPLSWASPGAGRSSCHRSCSQEPLRWDSAPSALPCRACPALQDLGWSFPTHCSMKPSMFYASCPREELKSLLVLRVDLWWIWSVCREPAFSIFCYCFGLRTPLSLFMQSLFLQSRAHTEYDTACVTFHCHGHFSHLAALCRNVFNGFIICHSVD